MGILDRNKNKLVVDMTSMNFDELKQSIIDFIKGRDDTFTDYDFVGSALNAIIDQCAYVGQFDATTANFLGNEMFLDSSILRSSVVSHAKELGYTPRSKTSARARVSVTVSEVQGNPATILLPAGTVFQSENDYGSHTFITINDYNLLPKDDDATTYSATGIELYQGTYKSWYFQIQDYETDRYIIPSANIDTSTLLVKVLPNLQSNSFDVYNKSDTIIDIDEKSNVFYVKEVENGYPEIYFGGGIIGKRPDVGCFIKCDYIETSGLTGNGCKNFTIKTAIDGYTMVTVETENSSTGGANAESIESIKMNAPMFFNAKNRAIVPDDYIILLKREFPNIADFNAWGGQDNEPKYYGFVMISAVDVDAFGTGRLLSADEQESILNSNVFRKNVFLVEPKFVTPEYTYLDLNITIRADLKNSLISASDIHAETSAFCSLCNTELNKFNSEFIYSDFVSGIRDIDGCIGSVIAEVIMKKDFEMLDTGQTIDFDNEILPGSIELQQSFTLNPDKLDKMTERIKTLDTSNDYRIYDDRNGNVLLSYVNPTTAETVKTNIRCGTVDYNTGKIKLDFISMTNPLNRIICESGSPDIAGRKNKILSLDMQKIKINIISK